MAREFFRGKGNQAGRPNAFFRGAADFVPRDELPKLASVVSRLFYSDNLKEKISPLPEIGIPVTVHCREFHCLGFLDFKGKWRDFLNSSELDEVIDWSDL